MIYAMSDIHGEYGKYARMLERIGFSEEDTLYVLGDVVDRGLEPVKILQDMAARENVYLLKGNHEAMAVYVLKKLNVEITAENVETQLDTDVMMAIMDWQANGGAVTMKAFRALPPEERADLIDYMDEAPAYEIADAGERTFVLVHSGLGNYRPGRKLRDYSFEELACMRVDYGQRYFEDDSIHVIGGHTPTQAVTGKAEVYRNGNNWLIDCGAAFGGRLACICLDTLEIFYEGDAEEQA